MSGYLLPYGYVHQYHDDLESPLYDGHSFHHYHESEEYDNYYLAHSPLVDRAPLFYDPPHAPQEHYQYEQDLINQYIEPAALHPSGLGEAEQYEHFDEPTYHVPTSASGLEASGCLVTQQSSAQWSTQSYRELPGSDDVSMGRDDDDHDTCQEHHHCTEHQAQIEYQPVSSSTSFSHPHSSDYGFQHEHSCEAETDNPTSPVDQDNWGNMNGSGHDPRIQLGPYHVSSEASIRSPHGYVASHQQASVKPPSPPLLARPFVPAHEIPHPPSFYAPTQSWLAQFKERQREKREATRASLSPYYYQRSATPIMDHLPIPDNTPQRAISVSQSAVPSSRPAPPLIVPSQSVSGLGEAAFRQAYEENRRRHEHQMKLQGAVANHPYLPDRDDLPPAPADSWARSVPTQARPHPLVFSEDGYHPLIKPEPQDYNMSSSSNAVTPTTPAADSVPSPTTTTAMAKAASTSTSTEKNEKKQVEESLYQDRPLSRGSILKVSSTRKTCEKKPVLACLFCRGRKIACGPPLPGSKDKTCNQCARRHLECVYPTESRRGQRKRGPKTPSEDVTEALPAGPKVRVVRKS